MRKYEGIFIFSPVLEEETRNGIVEKLKSIVEEKGSINSLDEWGSRKLAYEIEDFKEGYYVLINFSGDTSIIAELERICKITEGVIRDLIIKLED